MLIHLSPAESAALDRLVAQRGSSRQEILHQAIAGSRTLGAESSRRAAGSVADGDRAVPLRLTPSELTALAPWSERSDERVSEALRAFVREHDEGPSAD